MIVRVDRLWQAMSKLKCPRSAAIIGAVVAAHAGRATSAAKAEAARHNARKGGWPKGRPRKPHRKPGARSDGALVRREPSAVLRDLK